MQTVVGVDFGSSRVKAAAFARDGSLAAVAARETPREQREDGDDFRVLPMLEAGQGAVRDLGLPPGSIAALGLTSMGEAGTVLRDGRLAQISFPAWYDARGEDLVRFLQERFGACEAAVRTGQHLRINSTVAKLGHLAPLLEAPLEGEFLGLCGAFAWQLTGRGWQDESLAITSGIWDSQRHDYWLAPWNLVGLGQVALAPVKPPGHGEPAAGELAESLGLAPGAPVVIAGHDHPVATVGAGVRPGEVGDSLGTGEALIAAMDPGLAADAAHCRDILLEDDKITFEVWPSTGRRAAVYEWLRPGLAMRTFLRQTGLDRSALEAQAGPPVPGRQLDEEMVRQMELGVPGDLAPNAESWGALIDHYVMAANAGQDRLRRATGARGTTVLTGGGLRSARWRRAKALLGRKPMVVSVAAETAVRGAAAIAGTSLGWWQTAETMPGVTRLGVGSASDIDAAVGLGEVRAGAPSDRDGNL